MDIIELNTTILQLGQGTLAKVDASTFLSLAFLIGIAAQFRSMDGYSFLRGIISRLEGKLGIVYAVALVTAAFSPFILNDVVVLVLTPVLVRYSKYFNVNIAPLIVAEITFTNIASSLTPLGNPQNILLWQNSGISAREFFSRTWLPLALSALLAAAALYPSSRRLGGSREPVAPIRPRSPLVYLLAITSIIFSSDLVGLPRTRLSV